MKLKLTDLSSIIFFLFLIFVWHIWSFQLNFLFDSAIYISAVQHLKSGSFSYWWDIFTNLNAWQIRYRPFGFFGYFYLLRETCGINPICARSVNIILFFFSTILMFFILKRKNSSWIHAFIFTSVWILFFGHIHPVFTISNAGKYLFPLLAMMIGLFLIKKIKDKNPSIVLSLLLMALSAFCIFGNESHLGVSLVFLLALWSYSKLNIASVFIISFPTLIYLIFRVFIWKIPSADSIFTVSVQFSEIVYLLPRIVLRLFWSALIYEQATIIICIVFFTFLFFIYSVLGYFYYSYRNPTIKRIIIYLTMCGCLIIPYAVIPKHINNVILKAYCLFSVPFFLLLFEIYNKSISYKNKIIASTIIFFLLFQIFISTHSRYEYKKYYTLYEKSHINFSNKIRIFTNNLFRLNQDIVYVLKLNETENTPIPHYERLVAAGILAMDFPDLSFVLYGEKENYSIIINKGYIFKEIKMDKTFKYIDLFNRPIDKFTFPSKATKYKIDIQKKDVDFLKRREDVTSHKQFIHLLYLKLLKIH